MHWVPAYVGLGSNLDDPGARVPEALAALAMAPGCCCLTASPLYGSKPMGAVPQPDFCNAVAGLLTQLSVREFFSQLRALERQLGRTPPRERWGPRRIDLDLLVFGDVTLDEAELQLPHRGIAQRNFVLYPFAAIAPDVCVPGCGRVADLLRGVTQEGLWKWQGDAGKRG
jgi:2-amino-4-hydroxy-6-hydroxymethyldihydropteridine diphosphokinase